MVNHRDQAKFDRAQWLLKVLVPCWLIQISLCMILIGTSSYLLGHAIEDSVEERGTAVAWNAITIATAVVSMICTAYEIFRTISEAMTPKEVLVSNLVKLVGITLSMIMNGIISGTALWKWAIGTQVANGLLILTIIILASYAAWKWRRLAQYDDYHHPANVKPFGFKSDLKNKTLHSRNLSDEDWDVELRASWAQREVSMGNAVDITSPAPMAPSPEPTPTGTRERGSSFIKMGGRLDYSLNRDVNEVNEKGNRSRANSGSALMSMDTSYEPQTQIQQTTTTTVTAATSNPSTPEPTSPPATRNRSASYISVTGTGLDRRASYNHTRDTSFDEYVQKRRTSQPRRPSFGAAAAYDMGSASSRGSLPSRAASPLARSRARSGADLEASRLAVSAARQKQQQTMKNDVDDALGAEFGWGAASRTSSQDSIMAGGTPPAIAVTGGPVPGAKSVRNSLGRAPSDGSETGVLGAVPERREDDDHFEAAADEERRRRNFDEASRALLGGGQGDDEEAGHLFPAALRPASALGRPRGLSETIEFVVTPPPKSSMEEKRDARKTWGAAYSRP